LFIGLALCVVLFAGILASGKPMNPMKVPDAKVPVRPAVKPVEVAAKPAAERAAAPAEKAMPVDATTGRQAVTKGHPFAGLGIHVTGYGSIGAKRFYAVVMSQNGQRIFATTSVELVEAGYQVKRISDCAMGLNYGDVDIVAVCDAPQVGATPGEGVTAERPRPSEAAIAPSA
jgi:zona occludens toxin